MTGRPIPTPPPLTVPVANAASYVGSYPGPEAVRGAGRSAADNRRQRPLGGLQPWGGELFRTTHPDFRDFSLMFERRGGDGHRRELGTEKLHPRRPAACPRPARSDACAR